MSKKSTKTVSMDRKTLTTTVKFEKKSTKMQKLNGQIWYREHIIPMWYRAMQLPHSYVNSAGEPCLCSPMHVQMSLSIFTRKL